MMVKYKKGSKGFTLHAELQLVEALTHSVRVHNPDITSPGFTMRDGVLSCLLSADADFAEVVKGAPVLTHTTSGEFRKLVDKQLIVQRCMLFIEIKDIHHLQRLMSCDKEAWTPYFTETAKRLATRCKEWRARCEGGQA